MGGRIRTWWDALEGRPQLLAPPFEACFRCGYSLAGHTVPLRCPECATEHDEATRIVVREPGLFDRGVFRYLSWLGVAVIAVLAIVPVLWGRNPSGPVFGAMKFVGMAVFIGGTVMELLRRRSGTPCNYTAYAPEGLVISMEQVVHTQKWDEVRVYTDCIGIDAYVKQTLYGLRSTPEQRAQLAAAIEARLAPPPPREQQAAAATPPAGPGWPAITVRSSYWGGGESQSARQNAAGGD